jgi:hypothetical protein
MSNIPLGLPAPWRPPAGAHTSPGHSGTQRAWVWLIVGFVTGTLSVGAVWALISAIDDDERVVVAPPEPTTTTAKAREIDVHYAIVIHGWECAEVESLTDERDDYDDVPGAEVQVRNEFDEVLGWAAPPTHGDDVDGGCRYEATVEHVRVSKLYQVGNGFLGFLNWDGNDASGDRLDAEVEYGT